MVMTLHTILHNISVISWWSVLLEEVQYRLPQKNITLVCPQKVYRFFNLPAFDFFTIQKNYSEKDTHNHLGAAMVLIVCRVQFCLLKWSLGRPNFIVCDQNLNLVASIIEVGDRKFWIIFLH